MILFSQSSIKETVVKPSFIETVKNSGFIEWIQIYFNSCKSISVIHHINTMKNKRHMIISADYKKFLIKFNIYL